MWKRVTVWLFGTFVVFSGVTALATTPVFETWPLPGDPLPLEDDSASTSMTPVAWQDGKLPVWWDVTSDGHPDLIFLSHEGAERLSLDAQGAVTVAKVPVSPTLTVLDLHAFTREQVVLTPIDIDGDGANELFTIGLTATLWRLGEDGAITRVRIPLPAFLARSANDAAVGDLNRDGLPDIYVAMGHATEERVNFTGTPDVVLMNRGDGRFEAVTVMPTRNRVTLGATLVDIDRDGWLDVVESVEASWGSGPSVLLLNRTQAGDTVPTFEISEHRWDVGTSGMGVAAGDIDGDGHIDLYGTSAGHDLLVMGLGDGSFSDETFDRGILHEWAERGTRMQWSPNIVDLNADGRLDLVVRHGIPAYFIPVVPFSHADDVLYIQELDGTFSRVAVPERSEPGNGIKIAIGDLDGDGLPDVARNGLPGTALLWHNVTPQLSTTRRLTVRLAPTVSGSPPTGTIIIGSCGGVTHTRHITSGGKMGATAAYEAHLAWRDCADEALTVQVRWPSGAGTTDEVSPGPTLWRAEEPRWYQGGTGDTVTLDPTGVDEDEACMATEDGDWTCCDARCEVSRPSVGPATVRLDDRAPMTLPTREASWLLVTTPHLPTPGKQVALHVLHVGAPESFPGDAAVLEHDGEALSVTEMDEAMRSITVITGVAEDATTMPLTLRVAGNQAASWSPSVGFVFDSADPQHDLYPVRSTMDTLADVPWEMYVYTMAGIFMFLPSMKLTLSTPAGVTVPILELTPSSSSRRIRLRVAWDDLDGLDTLLLRDGPHGVPVTLPVVQPIDDADLFERVVRAECGLMRNRMEPGHGGSLGVLTFLDAAGHPLLVPSSEYDLELQGAELVGAVTHIPHLKDALFRIRSGETLGPGQITIRSKTGDELGRCEFMVVQWPAQPVDMAQSWTTLSHTELDRSLTETTRLRIGVNNAFGELIGADVWPTVSLDGGVWSEPLSLSDGGSISGSIGTTNDDIITIEVLLDGVVLDTHSVTVSGKAPGAGAPDGTGCASSTSSPLGGWLMLLCLVALRVLQRRRWSRPDGPDPMVPTLRWSRPRDDF